MTDYLQLAMTYGGFTSLDKVYLTKKLADLTARQKMDFITPPPSVVNAYFAEIYQKQSPQAATDYYFELSKALNLFGQPSFAEENQPFVRLNLSGRSYGLSYQNEQEEALLFAEEKEGVTEFLLLEIAQIFPHYKIFQDSGEIKAAPLSFDESLLQEVSLETSSLAQLYQSQDLIKLQGFNQEEVIDLARSYSGQRFYGFSQRQALIYIKK